MIYPRLVQPVDFNMILPTLAATALFRILRPRVGAYGYRRFGTTNI